MFVLRGCGCCGSCRNAPSRPACLRCKYGRLAALCSRWLCEPSCEHTRGLRGYVLASLRAYAALFFSIICASAAVSCDQNSADIVFPFYCKASKPNGLLTETRIGRSALKARSANLKIQPLTRRICRFALKKQSNLRISGNANQNTVSTIFSLFRVFRRERTGSYFASLRRNRPQNRFRRKTPFRRSKKSKRFV